MIREKARRNSLQLRTAASDYVRASTPYSALVITRAGLVHVCPLGIGKRHESRLLTLFLFPPSFNNLYLGLSLSTGQREREVGGILPDPRS